MIDDLCPFKESLFDQRYREIGEINSDFFGTSERSHLSGKFRFSGVIPSLFLDYIRLNCFVESNKATGRATATKLKLKPIEYLRKLYEVKTSPEYIDEFKKVSASCASAAAGASAAATGVTNENAAAAAAGPSSATKKRRQSVAGVSSQDFLNLSKDMARYHGKISKEVKRLKKMVTSMIPALNQGFLVGKHTAHLVTSSVQKSQASGGQDATEPVPRVPPTLIITLEEESQSSSEDDVPLPPSKRQKKGEDNHVNV